jgi:hypothetical protein
MKHAYSPEQYAEVVELWRRLIDLDSTSVKGEYAYVQKVCDLDLFALVLSDGEGTEDTAPLTLELISYSDYGGNDYDAANVRYLEECQIPGVETSTGGRHGTGLAWVQLGELHDTDTELGIERLKEIVGLMEGLTDYPVFHDETHGDYIRDLAEEAWDQYLCRDVMSELTTELGLDDTLDTLSVFGFSDDEIRELYYGNDDLYFRGETATSVVAENHDSVVKQIAQHIIAEWRRPLVDPNQCEMFAS